MPWASDARAEPHHDPHPRVRMEAVRAVALIREPRSIETALKALAQPTDRFLDYALWLTTYELQPVWLPALERGEFVIHLAAISGCTSPSLVGRSK